MSAVVDDWRAELAEFERSQSVRLETVARGRRRRLHRVVLAEECRSVWIVMEHADHDQVLYLAGFKQRLNAVADFCRRKAEHRRAGHVLEAVNGCLLVLHPGKLVTCLRLEPREIWFEWVELAGFDPDVPPQDEEGR